MRIFLITCMRGLEWLNLFVISSVGILEDALGLFAPVSGVVLQHVTRGHLASKGDDRWRWRKESPIFKDIIGQEKCLCENLLIIDVPSSWINLTSHDT